MELNENIYYVLVYTINEFERRRNSKILEKAYMQYTLPKAIKKFRQKGFKAGFQEFDQLHKRTVLKPRQPKELTQEEKQKALESLIFIKEREIVH